jgi:lipopolysaccharide export system permease protein
LFQIFFSAFLSPFTQYKARLFLKESNIDFFTSLIKEGKFINVVEGLTIFIDKKESNNTFSNIFIDDSSKSSK